MLIVWNVSNFFQNAFIWSQNMICSEKIVNLLHRGHDGTLPFDVRKKVIFRNYWNKHETAFSTIARNHRTRNISIQTILSDSNLYLSQHLLIQVRHLAPSSDYPLFKIIIIKIRRGPKLEGYAFANFGYSSGTVEVVL